MNSESDAREVFHHLLRREFGPVLRAVGFQGRGMTVRRIRDPVIQLVSIENSPFGGGCRVGLGIHLAFLPQPDGSPVPPPARLVLSGCEFRRRLANPDRSDSTWGYGGGEAAAAASVARLGGVFRRQGQPFFARFERFPEAFDPITPGQLDAGDLSTYPSQTTPVRAALIMARIARHLGRDAERIAFADVGLRHLGQAIALREELESYLSL